VTTREQKTSALKRELAGLVTERLDALENIKTKWASASVQDMRYWEETILRCEGRIAQIKKLQSWVEVS
jgi:hypothetical protein